MDLRSTPRLPILVGGAFLTAAVVGFVVVALHGGGGDHDDMDATAPPPSAAADPAAEPPAPVAAGTPSGEGESGEADPLVRVPYLSLAVADEIPVDPPMLLGPSAEELAAVALGSDMVGGVGGVFDEDWFDEDWFDEDWFDEEMQEEFARQAREFAETLAALDDPDELEDVLDTVMLVDEIIDAEIAPAVLLPASRFGPAVELGDEEGAAPAAGEDASAEGEPARPGSGLPLDGRDEPDGPLVDVCADAAGWCDAGVGGTVLLAIDGPSMILDVRLATDPECVARFEDRPDAMGLEVVLTRPATVIAMSRSFDASFNRGINHGPPGSDELADWEARRDGAGPDDLVSATLCREMAVSPGAEFSRYHLIVSTSASEPGSGGLPPIDDEWRGVIQLPGFGEPPDVRIVPETWDTVRVEVPTTAQWRADLLAVDLASLPDDMPSGDPAAACAAVEAVRRTERDPRSLGDLPDPRFGTRHTGAEPGREAERVEVGPWPGSPPEWRFLETHRLLRGPTATAICVRWTDDPADIRERFIEPTVRRRQVVVVVAPEVPDITAWIVGYRPAYRRVGGDELRAEIPTEVAVDLRLATRCAGTATIPAYPRSITTADLPAGPLPFEPVELCRFRGLTRPLPTPVTTFPTAGAGWLMAGTEFQGAIDANIGQRCVGIADCQAYTDVPVHRFVHPDELRRAGRFAGDTLTSRLLGHVRIAYTVSGGGSPPEWSIGLVEEYGDADEPPELPALSLTGSSLRVVDDCVDTNPGRPNQGVSLTAAQVGGLACAFRTFDVTWQADRPVVLVDAYLVSDAPERDVFCRRARVGGASTADPLANPTTASTVRVTNLCPGTNYALVIEVVDPETGARVQYGPRDRVWPERPPGLVDVDGWSPEVVERIWDVSATLPRLPIRIESWNLRMDTFVSVTDSDGSRTVLGVFKLLRFELDHGSGAVSIRTGHDYGTDGGCQWRLETGGREVTEDGRRSARLSIGRETQFTLRYQVLHQRECWTWVGNRNRARDSETNCRGNIPWDKFVAAAFYETRPSARFECGRSARASVGLNLQRGIEPPATATGVDGRRPRMVGS